MLGPPRGALTAAQSAALAKRLPLREPRTNHALAHQRRQRRGRDDFRGRLRLAILARDGFRCQICGQSLTLTPGQPNSGIAGHIVPAWAGGRPVESNGRAECLTCSNRAAGREQQAAAAAAREAQWERARADRTPNVW